MEIGGEVIRAGEKALCAHEVGETVVRGMAEAAVASVLGLREEAYGILTQLRGKGDDDGGGTVQAMNTLACIFTEAARVSAREEELRLVLTGEVGMPDKHAAVVSKVYQHNTKALGAAMARTASTSLLPQLQGVEWKLDFTVNAAGGDKYFEPVYHIVFKMEGGACTKNGVRAYAGRNFNVRGKDVKFTCSLEDLHDLVDSLRTACKSLESRRTS